MIVVVHTLSIVTVSMNRTEHLLQQAPAVARLHGHAEHVILDFGSKIPICRDQLPRDERIKLHRVECPNGRWWLTHSYNLAFALSSGEFILKLDADVLPSQQLINALLEKQAATNAHLMCNRLTLQDWSLPSEFFTTNGLFLCKRSSLDFLNGFNPYISGWGWDEIDFYSRFFLAGFPLARLPDLGIDLVEHGDDKREVITENKLTFFPLVNNDKAIGLSKRLMRANNEKNRLIAAASIVKNISWSSSEQYLETFNSSKLLPYLPRQILFDHREYDQVFSIVARSFLDPSPPFEAVYRLLRKLRLGPYSLLGARRLLEYYGVDFSLVS